MAEPLVEVTRRDVTSGRETVESRHAGDVAVVDADGHLLAGAGDPRRVTFVRSAVKPFQAAACLSLLGDEADGLTPQELAVAWASHRAEPVHLATVRALLHRAGVGEAALTCPPDHGIGVPGPPERIRHNCSGKHAMFALAGARIGCPPDRLLDPAGPLQREVLARLEQRLGRPRAVAVDGCGAPTVAVPLDRLARAFAAFPVPGTPDGRLVHAGHAHPELVGGTGTPESALLRLPDVVAKPGAEGVFAARWRVDGRAVAAAVKIHDGAGRAAAALIVALVRATGVDVAWEPPPVTGGGAPVGRVRVPEPALKTLVPA